MDPCHLGNNTCKRIRSLDGNPLLQCLGMSSFFLCSNSIPTFIRDKMIRKANSPKAKETHSLYILFFKANKHLKIPTPYMWNSGKFAPFRSNSYGYWDNGKFILTNQKTAKPKISKFVILHTVTLLGSKIRSVSLFLLWFLR